MNISIDTARNVTICAGVYYLATWISPWPHHAWTVLTEGILYSGFVGGVLVLPIVSTFPIAIIAALIGFGVTYLVTSPHPDRWALLPALLLGGQYFRGHHWAVEPGMMERGGQAVGSVFWAASCIIGGQVAVRVRGRREVVRRAT
jgi:hypothetical protein